MTFYRFLKRCGIISMILAAFCTVSVSSAFAQDADKEEVYDLGEIVVSADGQGIEAVTSMIVITAEEIVAMGARNLGDIVALYPGIVTTIKNKADLNIDLRGLRTKSANVFLDGVPLSSPYDGKFDPFSIPIDNVAEIKISFGAASALYGDGGDAGVIDVITKKGKAGLNQAATVEMDSGTQKIVKYSLSASDEKNNLVVSVGSLQRDSYPMSGSFTSVTTDEDGGVRENSDRKEENLFVNYTREVTDDLQLGVVYSYEQATYGMPPVTNAGIGTFADNNAKFQRMEKQTSALSQVAASYDISDTMKAKAALFSSQQTEKFSIYDDNTYSTQVKKKSGTTDTTLNASGVDIGLNSDFGSIGKVAVGITSENQSWAQTGFLNTKDNTPSTINSSEKLSRTSINAEYSVFPIDASEIVVGIGTHSQTINSGTVSGSSHVLAGNYQLSEGTLLRASLAHKIRFPYLKELFDTDAGNAALKPQTADHQEIGIEQVLSDSLNLGVNLYAIDAKDYIEKVAITSKIDQYKNNDHYQFQGMEVSVGNNVNEDFYYSFNYTYLRTKDLSPNATADELHNRPQDKAVIKTRYKFDSGISLAGTLLYVANQYIYDSSTPVQKLLLEPYTVLDVRASKKFLDNMVEGYCGIDNLTDADYYDQYGLQLAGRTIYVGATARF